MQKGIPTASALVSTEGKRKFACIFCMGSHENSLCEKAKKMSYKTRKNIAETKDCCYRCLKFHYAKNCTVNVVCDWCNNRHCLLMYQSFAENREQSSAVNKNSSEMSINSSPTVEYSFANFWSLPNVLLQTLTVILYSETREITVRAIFDSGAQRSYIKPYIAKELKYRSLGQ